MKVNGREAQLDTIQCKNVKWHEKKRRWSSLGVAIGSENTQPVEGSAGYSYCGLEAFCKLASRRLGMDVQIDSRIVAVSFECRDTFQLPEDKKLRWWFREMFEPTKPVLPPRSPSEDEDHDHDLDENEDKDEAEEEENDEENSDDDDDQTSNAA